MEPLAMVESHLLRRAMREATRLAARGEVAAARMCLVAGLERVREEEADGASWAGELASDYALALGHFEEVATT